MNWSLRTISWSALLALLIAPLANATPVTSGLQLWLDADDATTITLDSGFITQWNDKSGNSYHAVPTSVAARPTVGTGIIGGNDTIRFDGIDDGMTINTLSISRPYSIFVVDQYYGATQGRTLQSRTSGVNWLAGKWNGGNAHFAEGWITPTNTLTAGTNNPAIGEAVGRSTGFRSAYYVNGTEQTDRNNAVGNPQQLGLVGGGSFNEQSMADIAEILVYDRLLTFSERQQVGEYLETKWSIAGNYDINAVEPPPLPPPATLATMTAFTGGDPGEGLDLQGNIVYAVNMRGPGGLQIQDANFTADTATPGFSFSASQNILGWQSPSFGNTTNDDNLEIVMQSIRYENAPAAFTLAMNVTPGGTYQLQLLFAENNVNRGFDINVEGVEVRGDFTAGALSAMPGQGVVVTYTLVAPDNVLNVSLLGINAPFSDQNPVLQGLSLELIPEPTAFTLLLLGCTALLRLRRRRG